MNEGRSEGDGFAFIGEDVLYEDWLRIVRAHLRSPDGIEYTRTVVRHPGAVSVVPLLEDNDTVLLVRQYRPAVDRYLLEIPAGKRDIDGESSELTARRELIEEVGMEAGRLDALCTFLSSPGFSDVAQSLFLARDLRAVANRPQGIEEQHMSLERVRLRDVVQLIAAGAIVDAKTMLGLLLTREYLAGEARN